MLLEESVRIKCKSLEKCLIVYCSGLRPRNETAKSKEKIYAGRSITRISRKVQWTGHRSTIMIRALHMQYQIATVNRIRWRRVLFHADGTNEKKWRSRWRQMIRGTRLDLLKVTETNQRNESNVSTEFTTCKVHKRTNDDPVLSYNRCFFVDDFAYTSFPYRVDNIARLINIDSKILHSLTGKFFYCYKDIIISQIQNFQCIISIELIWIVNVED